MLPVDLAGNANSCGATYDHDRARGRLNAWGNTFPAEELPFGSTLVVDGVPFALVAKDDGDCDHVEVLGQRVDVRGATRVVGLALLCCGEMGPQEITIQVIGRGPARRGVELAADTWLRAEPVAEPRDGYACTHLHYAAGYELDRLRPVLWCARAVWDKPLRAVALQLGCNPLAHIFGITLLGDPVPVD